MENKQNNGDASAHRRPINEWRFKNSKIQKSKQSPV
jgi:hypothetical protein